MTYISSCTHKHGIVVALLWYTLESTYPIPVRNLIVIDYQMLCGSLFSIYDMYPTMENRNTNYGWGGHNISKLWIITKSVTN